MRTRVKICGITRIEDALAAVACGCDAIGLVFYDKSPRNVSPIQAATIVAALPAFVSAVGLFVDASAEAVRATLAKVRLDLLQFHGEESADYCRQFYVSYMKAIRVRAGTNLIQCANDYADAKALLVDAYSEGVAGGTGQVFDWNLIPADLTIPVVLAGGLNAGNVGDAIRRVRPYAV